VEAGTRSGLRRFVSSFGHAIDGIVRAVQRERNLRIHLAAALLAAGAALYFGISLLEWVVVAAMIGLVVSAELMNTAIEATVDLCTASRHPRAKYAKDTAAGAVLVLAATALVAGAIIFAPYIRARFT
jgi:diacylglycerol kinase